MQNKSSCAQLLAEFEKRSGGRWQPGLRLFKAISDPADKTVAYRVAHQKAVNAMNKAFPPTPKAVPATPTAQAAPIAASSTANKALDAATTGVGVGGGITLAAMIRDFLKPRTSSTLQAGETPSPAPAPAAPQQSWFDRMRMGPTQSRADVELKQTMQRRAATQGQ